MAQQNTISETETLQALIALQTKIDALSAQLFNATMLIEFVIQSMNTAAVSGKTEDLNVDLVDFQEFFDTRFKELQQQYTDLLAAKAGIGPSTAGAGSVIDLGD